MALERLNKCCQGMVARCNADGIAALGAKFDGFAGHSAARDSQPKADPPFGVVFAAARTGDAGNRQRLYCPNPRIRKVSPVGQAAGRQLCKLTLKNNKKP